MSTMRTPWLALCLFACADLSPYQGDPPSESGNVLGEVISAGSDLTCALGRLSQLYCWGGSRFKLELETELEHIDVAPNDWIAGVRRDGQLLVIPTSGLNDPTARNVSFDLGLDPVAQVAATTDRYCGIRVGDGSVFCVTLDDVVQEVWTDAFSEIAGGSSHLCGIRASSGSVVCTGWGPTFNSHGQATPPTATLSGLSAGQRHTCGLTPQGVARCWGDDSQGQSTPPQEGPFKTIASGPLQSCGLSSDGQFIACWGQSPFDVEASPQFTALGAGRAHTCALHPGGEAVCWGDNSVGQLAVPGS